MHFVQAIGRSVQKCFYKSNPLMVFLCLIFISCAGSQLSPTQTSNMVSLEDDAINTENGFNAVVMWRMRMRDHTDCIANKHPQFQWENIAGDKADLIQRPLWTHYNYSPPVYPSGSSLTRHGTQNINSLYLVQVKAGKLTLTKLFVDYKPGSFPPPPMEGPISPNCSSEHCGFK